ncbi:MauE/DoxX family redox-associated membrane protein [Acetobacter fallax]
MSLFVSFMAMAGMLIRSATGALFLGNGFARVSDVAQSASGIAAWRLLPLDVAFPAARILTGVEILLGGWLLSGMNPLGAGIVAAFMFMFFAGAMAVNVLRGRTGLDCGCLPGADARISWYTVLRNIVLAVLVALSGFCNAITSILLRIEGACLGMTLLLLALAVMHLSVREVRE